MILSWVLAVVAICVVAKIVWESVTKIWKFLFDVVYFLIAVPVGWMVFVFLVLVLLGLM